MRRSGATKVGDSALHRDLDVLRLAPRYVHFDPALPISGTGDDERVAPGCDRDPGVGAELRCGADEPIVEIDRRVRRVDVEYETRVARFGGVPIGPPLV